MKKDRRSIVQEGCRGGGRAGGDRGMGCIFGGAWEGTKVVSRRGIIRMEFMAHW